jgi:hypothetical protein
MRPQELARKQLTEKAQKIWGVGRWVGDFKSDLLRNLETSNLIDYLELFDADFDLDDFVLDFITTQPGFLAALNRMQEQYEAEKPKNIKRSIFINKMGFPDTDIVLSLFAGEVGFNSEPRETLVEGIKNSIKKWFL